MLKWMRIWKLEGIRKCTWWLRGEWASETDAHTSSHCTEAQHWLKLQERALTASFIPPIPRSTSLSLPLTVTRMLTEVFLQAQTGEARNYSLPFLRACMNSLCCFLHLAPLWSLFAWTPALSSWVRSWRFVGQSHIMDQGEAGDCLGNWVTGRLSWLMPVWTWRNGVHHQHRRVWWAAYSLGEEL